MADGVASQVLKKEVTCPLCLDLFKEPKKLPCDHVFCKECLISLIQHNEHGTVSCPECRTAYQVQSSDSDSFPTAFRVNRLLEAYQNSVLIDICQAHNGQQLALYCTSCEIPICRDCLLQTKDHKGHTVHYINKIAPICREVVCDEISLAAESFSNALMEINAAEDVVVEHATQCYDDIDHAFERLHQGLDEIKEVIKKEISDHYTSADEILKCRTYEVKEAEDEVVDLATSLESIVNENDYSVIAKLDLIFAQVERVHELYTSLPLQMPGPQLIKPKISVDLAALQDLIKTNCSYCNLADSKRCLVAGAFSNMTLDHNHKVSFTILLMDSKGKICHEGQDRVEAELQDSIHTISGIVEPVIPGFVRITFIPYSRGEHQLSIEVNGTHIRKSPMKVMVTMPPKYLSTPVVIVAGLGQPTSLINLQGKILAIERSKNRILAINMDVTTHSVEEVLQFTGIEVKSMTQDKDENVYVTTDHKVYKLHKEGRVVMAIGYSGSRNAEFLYPSGLRINKEDELYICDSNNHRIQVFDLNLNYKRSFGRKGTRRGKFDFPTDIDFDDNSYIYITDYNNHRIQIFTPSEDCIRTIGNSRNVSATFDRPMRLCIQNEYIYVTDHYRNQIVVLTLSGELVTMLGNGDLKRPEGIAVDKAGFVYVTSHYSEIVVF